MNRASTNRRLLITGGLLTAGNLLIALLALFCSAYRHVYRGATSVTPVLFDLQAFFGMAVLATLAWFTVRDKSNRSSRPFSAEPHSPVETHYRLIMDMTEDGVCFHDAEYRISIANRQLENLFGLAPGKASGCSVFDFVYADDREMMRTALTLEQADGLEPGEIRLQRSDGATLWVRVAASQVCDIQGRLCGGLLLLTPIDALKVAESELRRQRGMLATLFDTLPLNLFIKDGDSRFVMLNDQAAAFLGCPREAVIGKRSDEFLPAEVATRTLAEDAAVLASGGVRRYELKYNDTGTLLVGLSRVEIANQSPVLVGYGLDISERKRMEQALMDSERRFRSVFENAPVGLSLQSPDGSFLQVNPKLCEITGYSATELQTRTADDITCPRDLAADRRLRQRLAAGEIDRIQCEKRYVRKDGETVWAAVTSSLIRNCSEQYLVTIVEDTTERHIARQAQQRLAAVLRATPDIVVFADRDGQCQYVNPAGKEKLGLSTVDVARLRMTDLVPAWLREAQQAGALQQAAEQGVWHGETVMVRRDGEELQVSQMILAHRNGDGEIAFFSLFARDITERKHYEALLEHQANHDAMSGLPNRNLLRERLALAIATAAQEHRSVAVLFLDLDYFKVINDSLGHHIGDMLLTEVADRLRACLNETDTVARLGGDEFVVVLTEIADEAAVVNWSARLMAVLARGITVAGHDLFVTCSMGAALYPRDGEDFDSLIRHADIAMYRAKEKGRNTLEFFASEMRRHAQQRLTLENNLRGALARNEFSLVYQPIVDLRSGRICSVEALLRWRSAELGVVPPSEFIPVAEAVGLIAGIGEWVLRTACAQNRAWQDAGLPAISVAVNLSARQLLDGAFASRVADILAETRLAPGHLELELTESMFMQNHDLALRTIRILRQTGVRLSIDDFGTGYSSLSYLKSLPVDTLKLDRSFVAGVTSDPDDSAIALAVIAMARSLRLKVVAEGVETAGQLDYLRRHQCDLIQGYYFMPPADAETIGRLLHENRTIPLPKTAASDPARTVLVVDDEANMRASLKRLLRMDGYRVLTAGSAAEGFELLAAEEVGVIISDQRMPAMSGIEFLSRVKGLYPDTVRIVLSGYTELRTVTDAVNHGAVYKFLTKPWDNARVSEIVRDAFDRYRQARKNRPAGWTGGNTHVM